MKALVYTGTQELIYRDEKNPSEVNGESILKVHASGICGSDMHAYHGKDDRRIPPLILGHEVSGEVQNGKFKGKDVVLNPLITCGKCDYCKKGREHLCPTRIILGMNRPIERQGVFAEFVSTPDQNIYEIPNGLDKNEAPVADENTRYIDHNGKAWKTQAEADAVPPRKRRNLRAERARRATYNADTRQTIGQRTGNS